MAEWTLVPSLVALRGEFNSLNPDRDKGADGSIGDSAHTSSSDHTPDEDSNVLRDHDADSKNEVHAVDVDSSGPWPGPATQSQKQRFHAKVMRVIALEKAKWRDANDMCRLNYAIWDGKIYDKDNDFEPRTYTGSDKHTNHAHFSGRYETRAENDTRPWGVKGDDDMPLIQAEFDKIRDIVRAEITAQLDDVAKAVATWDGYPAPAGSTNADGTPNTHWGLQSYITNIYGAGINTRGYASSGLTETKAVRAAVADLATLVTSVKTEIIAELSSIGVELTEAQMVALTERVAMATGSGIAEVQLRLTAAGNALAADQA